MGDTFCVESGLLRSAGDLGTAVPKTQDFTAAAGGFYSCQAAAGSSIVVSFPASGDFSIFRASGGAVLSWDSVKINGTTVAAVSFPVGLTQLKYFDGGWWTMNQENSSLGWIQASGISLFLSNYSGLVGSGGNVTTWTSLDSSPRVFAVGSGTPLLQAAGTGQHPCVAMNSGTLSTAHLAADNISDFTCVFSAQFGDLTAERTVLGHSDGATGWEVTVTESNFSVSLRITGASTYGGSAYVLPAFNPLVIGRVSAHGQARIFFRGGRRDDYFHTTANVPAPGAVTRILELGGANGSRTGALKIAGCALWTSALDLASAEAAWRFYNNTTVY